MKIVNFYGMQFPEFDLHEAVDEEIREFCRLMACGGAWVMNYNALAQLMMHKGPEQPIVNPADEECCYALYLGCVQYIWQVMPSMYRYHIIAATGEDQFQLVGHNYLPFRFPAEWLADNISTAFSISDAIRDAKYTPDTFAEALNNEKLKQRTQLIKVRIPVQKADVPHCAGENIWAYVDDATKKAYLQLAEGVYQGTLGNNSMFFTELVAGVDVTLRFTKGQQPEVIL